jgi:nitrous oxidase accessory protein NosD
MIRVRPLLCIVGFAVSILATDSVQAAVRYVNPDGLCGGNAPCYTNLAAAVAAASNGDLIIVQAALYPLSARVDINKSVRILGPQNGVNPLPSQGTSRTPGNVATEAIFDGGGTLATLLRVLANDVEINGIEVRNGTSDLIDSPAGTPLARVAVRNCIIHNSSGDEGIQLRNQSSSLIECNHVYSTAGDGINMCCSSTQSQIRFNEVHDIASVDAAIYVYDSSQMTIQGNLVYTTTSNDGIKLGTKTGTNVGLSGGSIIGNTVRNTRQDGIAVYTSNVLVSCNEVTGSRSENGGIYTAFAVSGLTIVNNHVHDNVFDVAKWGNPAGIMLGTGPNANTFVVTGNRLVNNSPNGMTNRSVPLLTAENNWWGSATGPGPVGPGLGDQVSTNIDFTPWLLVAPNPVCPPVEHCGEPVVPTERRTWGDLKARYR